MQAEPAGEGEGRHGGKGRVKGCCCQVTTQVTGAQTHWALEAGEDRSVLFLSASSAGLGGKEFEGVTQIR